MKIRIAEPMSLSNSIKKALEQDANSCDYRDDGIRHTFAIKAVEINMQELMEMLAKLDAGQRVRTKIMTTVTHRWDALQPGAEDLDDLHFVEIWREETPDGTQLRVDALWGCYWELIPEGSPGAVGEQYWNPTAWHRKLALRRRMN